MTQQVTFNPDTAPFNVSLPANPANTSVHEYLDRIGGDLITKQITLSANNTTASINLFLLTGACQVFRLYAQITTKTTLANCTATYFNLYDGTARLPITKNNGVLSGVAVGSVFSKQGAASTTMTVGDATVGALMESASADPFYPFNVVAKAGVATNIALTYSTTDAPINAVITVYCEYRPINGGSLVAAA
jgi:hypothetical protein